jgi:uncharacterized SAM-binding protein YcdF (DUF218 family)
MPRAVTATGRASVGRTLATVVVLGLAGVVVVTAYATFRVWARGTVDEAPVVGSADAIVVLGAAQYDGRPSAVLRARVDHAIALYRDGRAPVLLMTGGGREGDRTTEAATARAYAIAQGVPSDAILIEDRGRSTQESLEAVSTILAGRGSRSAIFVSDRMHMLRVVRIAKDLRMEAYGSPATDSPSDSTLERRLDATAHELGALAWYGLVGRPLPEVQGGAPGS